MNKTIAIIPAKGREPLLYLTVKRLVNNHIHTICVGHTMGEKCVVECAGGEFIIVKDNIPLGHKWQIALDKARELNPASVLYMGSSDWVSKNWCATLQKDLDAGYAMSGTKGIYFLDIQPKNVKRLIWWGGYLEDRGNEPIGTGRLFCKEILDLMDWRLFDITKDSSIDYCQMLALKAHENLWEKDKLVCFNNTKDIAALSISTYRWHNKHKFENESRYATARKIDLPDRVLREYFKEAVNLFNE
jgi:hypothetical protein